MKDKIRAILKKLYESAFEDSVGSSYLVKGTGYGVEDAFRDIDQEMQRVVEENRDNIRWKEEQISGITDERDFLEAKVKQLEQENSKYIYTQEDIDQLSDSYNDEITELEQQRDNMADRIVELETGVVKYKFQEQQVKEYEISEKDKWYRAGYEDGNKQIKESREVSVEDIARVMRDYPYTVNIEYSGDRKRLAVAIVEAQTKYKKGEI